MSFVKLSVVLSFVLAVGINSVSATTPAPNEAKLFWIFLTTGKSTEGVAGSEIQKMQTAHLENFRRLAGEGKLLTAGPMNDPKGKLRGIVVIKAADEAAVKKMFEADPYITNGFMKVESHQAAITFGKFATKITPSAMEELRLVVLSRPPSATASEEILTSQGEYTKGLFENGSVLLATRFVGDSARQIVWIAPPRTDLKGLVESSPIVANAAFEHQIMPLYMGKGSIESKTE